VLSCSSQLLGNRPGRGVFSRRFAGRRSLAPSSICNVRAKPGVTSRFDAVPARYEHHQQCNEADPVRGVGRLDGEAGGVANLRLRRIIPRQKWKVEQCKSVRSLPL
jgi:hypothetical protein